MSSQGSNPTNAGQCDRTTSASFYETIRGHLEKFRSFTDMAKEDIDQKRYEIAQGKLDSAAREYDLLLSNAGFMIVLGTYPDLEKEIREQAERIKDLETYMANLRKSDASQDTSAENRRVEFVMD